MSTEWSAVMATPLPDGWRFAIRCLGDAVCETAFLPPTTRLSAPVGDCAVRAVAAAQHYFAGGSVTEALALEPAGTPYQQRVWAALRALTPGHPSTYGQLALQLASGPRAVAGACRANPIPLFIPCHRVVASRGAGGFMGQVDGPALRLKHWLLNHESSC